jgi:hypothetical protein
MLSLAALRRAAPQYISTLFLIVYSKILLICTFAVLCFYWAGHEFHPIHEATCLAANLRVRARGRPR